MLYIKKIKAGDMLWGNFNAKRDQWGLYDNAGLETVCIERSQLVDIKNSMDRKRSNGLKLPEIDYDEFCRNANLKAYDSGAELGSSLEIYNDYIEDSQC